VAYRGQVGEVLDAQGAQQFGFGNQDAGVFAVVLDADVAAAVADQQPVALAQVGAGVADRRVGVAGLAKHQRGG
jgi:hypothetical protein